MIAAMITAVKFASHVMADPLINPTTVRDGAFLDWLDLRVEKSRGLDYPYRPKNPDNKTCT